MPAPRIEPMHQRQPGRPGRRDTTALAFVVAMGFVLATTAGAALSATGSGTLKDIVHAMGFGSEEAVAEPAPQNAAVKRLQRDLRAVVDEIEILKSRAGSVDPAIDARLAQLDAGFASLRSQTEALRAEHDGEIRMLKANLTGIDVELGALRSSIDARDEDRGNSANNLVRRVDRLEHLVAATDATGSIASPPRRPVRPTLIGWSVQDAHEGWARLAGPGGIYDAYPGGWVPGLGHITAMRLHGSRWVIATEKGLIAQR